MYSHYPFKAPSQNNYPPHYQPPVSEKEFFSTNHQIRGSSYDNFKTNATNQFNTPPRSHIFQKNPKENMEFFSETKNLPQNNRFEGRKIQGADQRFVNGQMLNEFLNVMEEKRRIF